MRAVIESAKRERKSLGKSDDLEPVVEEPVKPKVDRPKILISIQGKDGHKQFRVYKDDKFERLFKMYANRINCNLECLVFCFDGDKVNPSATPHSLGLEEDDIIEVHIKSH
uniref:Ubiquitin-like protein SMT3 n=2 Tax=Anthurium amnicola TaxID=1678845 RepID=A0A1D1Y3J3_9ARAE